MVSRKNHVRHLHGDTVDPLLPQIPIRLIQDTHVTTTRTTLVGDLAVRERSLVVWRHTARKLAVAAVVAYWPVTCAWQDAAIPVICVGNVTTMPGKGNSLINSLVELLERSAGIGVPHVIENSDSEGVFVTGVAGSLEAQHIGRRGAVGSRDLVVVGRVWLEVPNLNFVVELAALSDGDLGARRRSVISSWCQYLLFEVLEMGISHE